MSVTFSDPKYPIKIPKYRNAPKKPYKTAHTAGSQKGMGDYYGSGIVAKIGKMRSGVGFEEISPPKMKTPPRSLA